uniref:ComEC/Rec2-related protein n=1 Tax=Chlorobium chlorochromatii (strain CaD3) TaxID=340177 RepID=Q3ARK6_CHLCH
MTEPSKPHSAVKPKRAIGLSLAPYPAVRLLFFVIIGIVVGVVAPFSLTEWLWSVALSFALLLLTWLYERIRYHQAAVPHFGMAIMYCFVVVSVFATLSAYRLHYAPRNGLTQYAGRTVILYGSIESRPERSKGGASWVMEVQELFEHGKTVTLRDRTKVFMRMSADAHLAVQKGDMVRVKGKLDLLPEAANAGEFNPRHYGAMQQISVQLYAAGPWQVLYEGEKRLHPFEQYMVQPTYRYIMQALAALLPDGEERKLAAGVLTGERETMSEEVFEAFKRTGTAHILAVSGMNVGLLALIIQVFLQRLKITPFGRWTAFLLFVFLLILYSNVTGNSASVTRAAFMALVLIAGETVGQKTYPLNSLAVADLIILLINPLDLLNPGFLMTNGAVLALFLVYPLLHFPRPKNRTLLLSIVWFLLDSIIITLAASIGVSPVIAYYFGTFSLISFVANIPVVFFSTLLMYALVPMLVVYGLSQALASVFAAGAFWLARMTLQSALWFSNFSFASIPLKLDAVEVWLYYIVLAAVLLLATRKAWSRVAITFLLGVNLFVWYSLLFRPNPIAPTLLTVNLGRNLATIVSNGSESVLIDVGKKPKDYQRISAQFERFGIVEPTAVVQFYSPDSLILATPTRHHFLRSDSLLRLSSMVITRPDEKMVKLWSRNQSYFLASGTSRLKAGEPYCGDVACIWIYRFGEKQRIELERWLTATKPKEALLVPSSFLSRVQLVALHRFAAAYPHVEVRSKTKQVVVNGGER